LPNIRRDADTTLIKKDPNISFYLISIDSSPETRYKRTVSREQNPGDKSKSWEQFQADAKLETEVTIREVMEKAQFNIDNNGSFDDFQKQIKETLKKITADNV